MDPTHDDKFLHRQPSTVERALSIQAKRWLERASRCEASEVLFDAMHGRHCASRTVGSVVHPTSVFEFYQCRELCHEVSYVGMHLIRAAALSPTWQRLCDSWMILAKSFDDECEHHLEAEHRRFDEDRPRFFDMAFRTEDLLEDIVLNRTSRTH